VTEGAQLDAEFVAEGHALVESLARDLLLLGHEFEAGRQVTELLEAALRGAHTLKSLAELCGASAIAGLAAPIAELLERLRGGSLPVDEARIDALSEGVGAIGRQLDAPRGAPLDTAAQGVVGRIGAMLDGGTRHVNVPLCRTVPVDVALLDRLLELAGGLDAAQAAVTRLTERLLEQADPTGSRAELRRAERRLRRQFAELREGLLDARRVPLADTLAALAEAARDAARDVGAELVVVVEGGETSVDERVIEELRGPLLELVRHAVRRGPSPGPRGGPIHRFTLSAAQHGGHVNVVLRGEGFGLGPATNARDPRRLAATVADERPLLAAPQASSLVAEAAPSPAAHPLGLSRVRAGLARLGGALDLDGDDDTTRLTLTVPVALACVRSLLVAAAGETFALPIAAVDEARFFEPAQLRHIDGRAWIVVRGEALPLAHLAALLGLGAREAPRGSGPARHGFVVVLRIGRRRLGLVVDRLEGQHDLLPKPLGPSLARVRCFRGAAVLGEHALVLVLDPAVLLDEALADDASSSAPGLGPTS